MHFVAEPNLPRESCSRSSALRHFRRRLHSPTKSPRWSSDAYSPWRDPVCASVFEVTSVGSAISIDRCAYRYQSPSRRQVGNDCEAGVPVRLAWAYWHIVPGALGSVSVKHTKQLGVRLRYRVNSSPTATSRRKLPGRSVESKIPLPLRPRSRLSSTVVREWWRDSRCDSLASPSPSSAGAITATPHPKGQIAYRHSHNQRSHRRAPRIVDQDQDRKDFFGESAGCLHNRKVCLPKPL